MQRIVSALNVLDKLGGFMDHGEVIVPRTVPIITFQRTRYISTAIIWNDGQLFVRNELWWLHIGLCGQLIGKIKVLLQDD